jgi:hypothetical protein
MAIHTIKHRNERKTGLTAVFAMIFVLALLVRAIVPLGFMPDASSNAPFKMVICTIYGPKTITIDSSFDSTKSHSSNSKSDVKHKTACPFSLNTALIDTDPAPGYLNKFEAPAEKTIASVNGFCVQTRFFGNSSSQSPPASFS